MAERDAAMSNKKQEMKVDIPAEMESTLPALAGGLGGGGGGLARQGSITKANCLCAPTTHAGSFRCRLHRSPTPILQMTKSIDQSTTIQDSQSKSSS